MPTSVTPAVIAVALGKTAPVPGSVQDAQWQMWIEDAVMLIDSKVAELEAEYPDQMKVDYVVREAVVAHVRRPDDATQVTVSVDDGSSSKTYKSGNGLVTITDAWWLLLGLMETHSGAYSVDMVGRSGGHPPWCSIYFGGTCSCGTNIAGGPIYEPGWRW